MDDNGVVNMACWCSADHMGGDSIEDTVVELGYVIKGKMFDVHDM